MKKISVLFLLFVFFLVGPVTSSASSSFVGQWIDAMKNRGTGLNSVITHDFQYTRYSFDFKAPLFKGSKGDIPFFAKESSPKTIDVEDTTAGYGGEQVVTLRSVAESGLYREWVTYLVVRPDGISKVTEIATEGQNDGFPPGCPETAYKRDLIVSLHGSPTGLDGPKVIRLYSFNRDTDSWDYVHPGFDEKLSKYCHPRPETMLNQSEILVFGMDGQLERAETLAAKHKGEKDEYARGISFFAEDGTNFPGRLFNVGGGKEGLLITFAKELHNGEEITRIGRAILYTHSGKQWNSVWAFDVAFDQMRGFLGGSSGEVEWSLKSTLSSTGEPAILATLVNNSDDGYSCNTGTTITFHKKGKGFRAEKNSPKSCFLKRWGSGSLKTYLKEDKAPKYNKPVQEIDWRFQR